MCGSFLVIDSKVSLVEEPIKVFQMVHQLWPLILIVTQQYLHLDIRETVGRNRIRDKSIPYVIVSAICPAFSKSLPRFLKRDILATKPAVTMANNITPGLILETNATGCVVDVEYWKLNIYIMSSCHNCRQRFSDSSYISNSTIARSHTNMDINKNGIQLTIIRGLCSQRVNTFLLILPPFDERNYGNINDHLLPVNTQVFNIFIQIRKSSGLFEMT